MGLIAKFATNALKTTGAVLNQVADQELLNRSEALKQAFLESRAIAADERISARQVADDERRAEEWNRQHAITQEEWNRQHAITQNDPKPGRYRVYGNTVLDTITSKQVGTIAASPAKTTRNAIQDAREELRTKGFDGISPEDKFLLMRSEYTAARKQLIEEGEFPEDITPEDIQARVEENLRAYGAGSAPPEDTGDNVDDDEEEDLPMPAQNSYSGGRGTGRSSPTSSKASKPAPEVTVTQAQLKETAKNRGMTVDQVMMVLRTQYPNTKWIFQE